MALTDVIKGKIGEDDINWATGGTGAVETFDRPTSTGGLLTQEKIDASHLKFRTAQTGLSKSVEALVDGTKTISLKPKDIDTGAITSTGITASGITRLDSLYLKSPWADVKAYGAVGNGTTDDTVAIQAALNANQVVYIPNGTFKITSALTLNAYQIVFGNGPQSIIYQATASTVGITNANDTVLKDFTLRGPGITLGTGSIGVNSGYPAYPWTAPITESAWLGVRSVMQNLTVENWGFNGLSVVSGGKVINCHITNCNNEAIIAEGYDILIDGNYIKTTYSWGIDAMGSRITISNNDLISVGDKVNLGSEDCGGIIVNGSLWTTGTNDVHVIDNTVDGSTNEGILIYAPDGTDYNMNNIIVSGNIVKNVNSNSTGNPGAIDIYDKTTSGGNLTNVIVSKNIVDTTTMGYGIRAWGLTGGTIISNNTIINAADSAIHISDGAVHSPVDISVVGNIINGLTNHGISCTALTKFVIANNLISGNTTDGVGINCTSTTGKGLITGNVIDTCLVGLFTDATGDYIKILNNDVSNGNTTPATIGGTLTNCRIKGNDGYVTENSGISAAISTGATIAHGLAATPAFVSVTPAEAGPTDVVATVGATTITVAFGGGGSKTFFWSAKTAQSK